MPHPLVYTALVAFSRLMVAGGLVALVAAALRRR
jgi:hypothetical protein